MPLNKIELEDLLNVIDGLPTLIIELGATIDLKMRQQNTYYDNLITGKVLQSLKIGIVAQGAFTAFMKSIGKPGVKLIT